MSSKLTIDISEVTRTSDENLYDWFMRTNQILNCGATEVDVPAIGFPYIQMRINKMFARTFNDELHHISKVLGEHGIKISFMVTDMGDFADVDYQQFAWILFNNAEEAVHARLLLDIHPDHLVSQHT